MMCDDPFFFFGVLDFFHRCDLVLHTDIAGHGHGHRPGYLRARGASELRRLQLLRTCATT
jgi:hypothetical protein